MANKKEKDYKRVFENSIVYGRKDYTPKDGVQDSISTYFKTFNSSGDKWQTLKGGSTPNYLPMSIVKKAFNKNIKKVPEVFNVDALYDTREATRKGLVTHLGSKGKTLIVHATRGNNFDKRKELFDKILQNDPSVKDKVIFTSIVPNKSMGYIAETDKELATTITSEGNILAYNNKLLKPNNKRYAAVQEGNKSRDSDDFRYSLGTKKIEKLEDMFDPVELEESVTGSGYNFNTAFVYAVRANYSDERSKEIFDKMKELGSTRYVINPDEKGFTHYDINGIWRDLWKPGSSRLKEEDRNTIRALFNDGKMTEKDFKATLYDYVKRDGPLYEFKHDTKFRNQGYHLDARVKAWITDATLKNPNFSEFAKVTRYRATTELGNTRIDRHVSREAAEKDFNEIYIQQHATFEDVFEKRENIQTGEYKLVGKNADINPHFIKILSDLGYSDEVRNKIIKTKLWPDDQNLTSIADDKSLDSIRTSLWLIRDIINNREIPSYYNKDELINAKDKLGEILSNNTKEPLINHINKIVKQLELFSAEPWYDRSSGSSFGLTKDNAEIANYTQSKLEEITTTQYIPKRAADKWFGSFEGEKHAKEYYNRNYGWESKPKQYYSSVASYFGDEGNEILGLMAVVNDNNLVHNGTLDETLLATNETTKEMIEAGPLPKHYSGFANEWKEQRLENEKQGLNEKSRIFYKRYLHADEYGADQINTGQFPHFVDILNKNKLSNWSTNLAGEKWGEIEQYDRKTLMVLNHITGVQRNALTYAAARALGVRFAKGEDIYDYLASNIENKNGNEVLTGERLANIVMNTRENMEGITLGRSGHFIDSEQNYSDDTQKLLHAHLIQNVIAHDYDKLEPETFKEYARMTIGDEQNWDTRHKDLPHHLLDKGELSQNASREATGYDIINSIADRHQAANENVFDNPFEDNEQTRNEQWPLFRTDEEKAEFVGRMGQIAGNVQNNTSLLHEMEDTTGKATLINPEIFKDFIAFRNKSEAFLNTIPERQKLTPENRFRADFNMYNELKLDSQAKESPEFEAYKAKMIGIYKTGLEKQDEMESRRGDESEQEGSGKSRGGQPGNQNASGSHGKYVEKNRIGGGTEEEETD